MDTQSAHVSPRVGFTSFRSAAFPGRLARERMMAGDDARAPGFTLVELLVVVTIIVILLAILVPALTQAMYHGNLTACSANLNAVAKGAIQYAMQNKQMWPYRTAISGQPLVGGTLAYEGPVKPWLQNDATYKFRRVHNLKEDGNDDRPLLGQYMPLKAFLDPLCGAGEIDVSDPRPDDPEHVLADYAILFGMNYLDSWKNSWQRKMGTRLNAAGHEKSTLVADFSATYLPLRYTSSSHQDKEGKATLQVRNRTNSNYLDAKWNTPLWSLEEGHAADSNFKSEYKGYIDFNEAFWDGSVVRYPNIRWDEWKWDTSKGFTHQFTQFPLQADGKWREQLIQLKNEDGNNHSTGADPHDPIELNP
jgi:prepilin-type N-terminal cleavage/methylation domain-containing protein